jgi:hypothetical protein
MRYNVFKSGKLNWDGMFSNCWEVIKGNNPSINKLSLIRHVSTWGRNKIAIGACSCSMAMTFRDTVKDITQI